MHILPIYILISTIDDGIERVSSVVLPPEDGVRYYVSWQQTGQSIELPQVLKRADIVVSTMVGRGLCRNRNNGIEAVLVQLAGAPLDAVCVIADDDERLEPTSIKQLRKIYGSNPKLDVALLRVRSTTDGKYLKPYPERELPYGMHERSYYVSSWEITCRMHVWRSGIRFDERFGLGSAELCAGEEEVLMKDICRQGFLIHIVPEDLARTNPETTGRRSLDRKQLRSKGAVYGYQKGWVEAAIRCLREAIGLRRRDGSMSFINMMKELWWGVTYIKRWRKN